MKEIVLKFGLISGAILAVMIVVMTPLYSSGEVDIDHGEIIGYSSMILSFLLVYFGIRTYRDTVGGGAVSFGKAFKVGILITLMSCAAYVISWQIVYYNYFPDFLEKYSAHVIESMREDGATEAAIALEEKKMNDFGKLYANPFVNIAFTFIEVFPVGLIVTLVSAAILRRKVSLDAPANAVIA